MSYTYVYGRRHRIRKCQKADKPKKYEIHRERLGFKKIRKDSRIKR